MSDDIASGFCAALILVALVAIVLGKCLGPCCERLDTAGYPPQGCECERSSQ